MVLKLLVSEKEFLLFCFISMKFTLQAAASYFPSKYDTFFPKTYRRSWKLHFHRISHFNFSTIVFRMQNWENTFLLLSFSWQTGRQHIIRTYIGTYTQAHGVWTSGKAKSRWNHFSHASLRLMSALAGGGRTWGYPTNDAACCWCCCCCWHHHHPSSGGGCLGVFSVPAGWP